MNYLFKTSMAVSMTALLSLLTAAGFAQNTQVMAILYGNAPAQQYNLYVAKPSQKAITVPVNTGALFPSGTTIGTPAGVTVKLTANGNQQELLPNSMHSVRISTMRETHKTIKGKVVHYVNNKTKNFQYKASGNKAYATAPGTVFSLQVDGDAATFQTLEGEIQMVEKVKVKVNQQSKNSVSDHSRDLTSSRTITQKAGETKYFDGTEEEVYYDTYDQAFSAIQQQLQYDEASDYMDFEQIADDNMLLGEIMLDNGNPNDAIYYLDRAVGFFRQMEFEELSVAEGYLLMGEAYYMMENYNKVNEFSYGAIDIITPLANYFYEEYQYAYEIQDSYLMEDIAYDLWDCYDLLGWSYDLLGDEANANKYYKLADQIDPDNY